MSELKADICTAPENEDCFVKRRGERESLSKVSDAMHRNRRVIPGIRFDALVKQQGREVNGAFVEAAAYGLICM